MPRGAQRSFWPSQDRRLGPRNIGHLAWGSRCGVLTAWAVEALRAGGLQHAVLPGNELGYKRRNRSRKLSEDGHSPPPQWNSDLVMSFFQIPTQARFFPGPFALMLPRGLQVQAGPRSMEIGLRVLASSPIPASALKACCFVRSVTVGRFILHQGCEWAERETGDKSCT